MPIENQTIKNKKSLEWIDINSPSVKDLKKLQKKYHGYFQLFINSEIRKK